MKCFAGVAMTVCAFLALGSMSLAGTASRTKKTSHSKTKSKTQSLDSIQLDLDESDNETLSRKPSAASEPVISSKAFAAQIAKAEENEKLGKFSEGVEILKPVAEKLTRRGLVLLARLYEKSGNPVAQLSTLELCLSTNPKDYVVQTMIGDALVKANRIDDAVAAYNEARKANKMYRPAYEGLLALFEKKDEHYESRVLVSDMISLFGDIPKYHSILCRLYTQGDFLAKAAEICRNATKLDPKNADNYVNLAASLRDQENAKEANEVMEKAVRRFPASAPVQTAAADLKIWGKDYGSAYTLFKKATTVDAKSDRAWLGLAQASFELQKNDESLKAFNSACDINKKNTKEFRVALGKLRTRGENDWAFKFESGMSQHCD
jgi:tetratricopeptide (TPR) repeat protein